ncbi:hypothetical protein [Phenylobacterium ferrooxidans]|uniref:Mu-like prophage FluMu N-terminal domain-containing protein n=1 Tax=Phenylobacterium ferrooxidans TaxID=2982689 RepID=A0ABW6CN45_9CAUL
MKKPKIRGLAAERLATPEDPGSYVRAPNGVLERTDTPQVLVDGPSEAAPAPVLPEASRRAIVEALQGVGAEVPDHLADPSEPTMGEPPTPPTPPVPPGELFTQPPVSAGGQTEEG